MSSKFNCSYMAMSSLTYIPGFSVKFFFQPIYTNYANYAYFDKRSHLIVTFKSFPLKPLNQITFKSFLLKPLNQMKSNLAGMVLGWIPFKIVSWQPALHSRWLLLLKIEISSIVHFCFIKMSSNFNCSYMAMSSLTFNLGFSVRFFQPVYSV